MVVSVQYLRAFAATWVALYHFKPFFLSFGGSPRVAALADHGAAGVLIFFVIAGFVMALTTHFEADPLAFMWRRLVRVFGGFLPVAVAFLAYKALTPDGIDNFIPGGIDLIGTFTLSNPNSAQILIFPAWTLPYELAFYAAFAACLCFGRASFAIASLFVIAAVLGIGYSGLLPAGRAWVLIDPMNITFVIGVVVGAIVVSEKIPHLALTGAASALFLAVGLMRSPDDAARFVWIGFGSGFLILALFRLEQAGLIRVWGLAESIGDASYAIYLLHAPLMYLMSTTSITGYLLGFGGAWALLAFYIAILLVASLAYHRFVERPIIRIGRLAWRTRRAYAT